MADAWRIGRFRLVPASRELLEEGTPVAIGGRAFDLLLALVEGRGRVLTKEQLLDQVWPGVVVEENNLTVQVSALRKLLGAQAVVTVAGRGYQLGLAPVPDIAAPAAAPSATGAPPLPDRPSIAVLPFDNLSGQPQDQLVCDGLTDDVITELARFRSLFVISRNTSFTYKGRVVDVRTVGAELGVRYVVEASLRRSDTRLRLNVRLVEAPGGTQVWAERYDRQMEDLFDVQEELTHAITAAVAPRVELSERLASRRRPPGLNAYQLALQAWATLRDPAAGDDRGRRERACRLAREALALDGVSSLAMRTLAWCRFTELWLQRTAATECAAEEAIELASRVIAADNVDHHAYHHRGLLQFMLERYEAGLLDLWRAHELNPNDAATLGYLGYFEAVCGRAEEGRALAAAAQRLSPRDPQRYLLSNQMSVCCLAAGDDRGAERHATDATVDAPWFPAAWMFLAISRAALGDAPGARAAVESLRRIAPEYLEDRLQGRWLGPDAALRARAIALLRQAAGRSVS